MDTFPYEIREIVYTECVKVRALDLLYASKRFYSEFSPFLREGFVLGFHIDPAAPATEVKLINADDNPWGNYSTIDATSAHPNYDILDWMPVDRFKGIRVLIDAPDSRDPGQLVRGWLQTNRLVEVLLPRWVGRWWLPRREIDIHVPEGRSTRRLPPFTIEVRDRGEFRQWHDGQAWKHSVPDYRAWDPGTQTAAIMPQGANSDLEIILAPFARIRDADAVTINLPRDAPSEGRVDALIEVLIASGRLQIPFGLNVPDGEPWDNERTLGAGNTLRVWLDYLLDDMAGPTAAMLRRDRFQYWCPTYEFVMGQCFHGFQDRRDIGIPEELQRDGIGSAHWVLDGDLFNLIVESWHDRFMSARAHFVAGFRDALRRHGQRVFVGPNMEAAYWYYRDELSQRGLLRADVVGNYHTFWETCYPQGIPPKLRNDEWEDTTNILPEHYRLVPPEPLADTAAETFPIHIGSCNVCDCDEANIEHVMSDRRALRNFLLHSNRRAEVPRFLSPIE
ncbi:uncharacterized protein Z520_06918 [Fonsecaea multimorphosa CBS 102226]|uniref:Uncharacterized protein n=1 Tax=Fonsecaea multimorphosa CBS 102226 TaxID=1442371 RepID=A0A0D2IKC0_9EURO|nr:uncharacterized protein Z520_06918 [Fonsecaea multimorphosa CBS 102226]KIX97466.1 hypothetical protein Z520_06918 [Fonsecaea multimorphosa CBS 102226]OAL23430.1 hypothetical protein AYO22_06480 [Fonsecaea multimorphosa]